MAHAREPATTHPAGLEIKLGEETWAARPSGALWSPSRRTLLVADLHLGKSERLARRGGPLLPPYEVIETCARLEAEIAALGPAQVICLGDSFDDAEAARRLAEPDRARLARLAQGRDWLWIAGNHDPGAAAAFGERADEATLGGVTLRHIAAPRICKPEASGHYHPKAALVVRGRRLSRRCFLYDGRRLILPAFGAYTGGLDATDPAFDRLLGAGAAALLCGARTVTPALRSGLAPRDAPR